MEASTQASVLKEQASASVVGLGSSSQMETVQLALVAHAGGRIQPLGKGLSPDETEVLQILHFLKLSSGNALKGSYIELLQRPRFGEGGKGWER